MRRRRSGIGITEIVVTGVILAVAIGGVLYWFHRQMEKSRDLAHRTACAATLSGLSRALAMYDNDSVDYGRPSGTTSHPYMGATDRDMTADPVPADIVADLFARNARSNLQTYALLVTSRYVSDGHFRCPSDRTYLEPKRDKKYGFDDSRNSSYAAQVTSTGYQSFLNKDLDSQMVIMADRPQKGRLERGSANHTKGLNIQKMNGSVVWSDGSDGNGLGVNGDFIFTHNPEADAQKTDSFLIWSKDTP